MNILFTPQNIHIVYANIATFILMIINLKKIQTLKEIFKKISI